MLCRNLFLRVASCMLVIALFGCSSNTAPYKTPDTSGTVKNSGVISAKNFSILADTPQPTVIDPTTNAFTKTDVKITAYIGDRKNQMLTDQHTIFFRTEYGTIDPSCVTKNGSCSVTWSAIKRPVPGGPGSDLMVTIIAYTIGEESFTDKNGNNIYDNADGSSFVDEDEPYVDANENGVYDFGEEIVDTVNGNDLTGKNGVHDIGDGFFNGPGCTHTSLCSKTVINDATIWVSTALKIDGP